MEAFITGIGWVSKESMGYNGCIKYFDQNATLPPIKRKDVISDPYKLFGRMDYFSKLGFAAISFALKDANINNAPEKIKPGEKNISIIASTVSGCIETDMIFQETMLRPLPSPAVFAYTLDSSFLGEASIYFGLTGESFVINEGKSDGLKGLFMALEIIDSGNSDIVLCGICNSDIKTNNTDSSIINPGALFFVLQKKCLNSQNFNDFHGTIKSTSISSYYYQNDIEITTLHGLAQECTTRKKITNRQI